MRTFIIITFYIIVTILSDITTAIASGYTSLPINEGDRRYLEDKSIYGEVIKYFNTDDLRLKNDVADRSINVCIKNAVSSDNCTISIFNTGVEKPLSNFIDASSHSTLRSVMLQYKIINGYPCVVMPTSRGAIPIICKHLSQNIKLQDIEIAPECKIAAQSCFSESSISHIKYPSLSISGRVFQCVTESLDSLFIQTKKSCPNELSNKPQINVFSHFVKFAQKAVRAALVLYVVFFFINSMLSPNRFSLASVIEAVVKAVLVMYFSVGITSQGKVSNGVTDWILPFASRVPVYTSQLMFNAAGNKGLCEFDMKNYKKGYEYYALWDAIDCRWWVYFTGMGISDNRDIGKISIRDAPGSGLLILNMLWFMFLGGEILLFICGIIFLIVFSTALLQFLSHFIVCMVTIYILTYLAPIFVPMSLFKHTHNYFESWLRILISSCLQPLIVAGALAILLTIFDKMMYGDCLFTAAGAQHQGVFIMANQTQESCKGTPGFKLLRYMSLEGLLKTNSLVFGFNYLKDTAGILVQMIGILMFTIIFSMFFDSVASLAASITNGSDMSDMIGKMSSLLGSIISSFSSPPSNQAQDKILSSLKGDKGGGSTDKVSSGSSK